MFFRAAHLQNKVGTKDSFGSTIWEIQTGAHKRGLSPKGANRAKTGPFGAISALPPWLWGAEELVPISPEKAPTSREMSPICPEKARFSRKDFPPIFSENLGLKPPFVSPRLDFPNMNFLTKALRCFQMFEGLYFVGPKNSRKIPAKFPARSPCRKVKISLTSFCRGAGRMFLGTW